MPDLDIDARGRHNNPNIVVPWCRQCNSEVRVVDTSPTQTMAIFWKLERKKKLL